MTLILQGRRIESVSIVDDDPNARAAFGFPVEELNLEPVPAEGPLPDLSQFVEETRKIAQAAICDYKLSVRNYASFNGAQLVALQYQNRFPAVLCTRWETASIDEMRRFRRYIPVLLRPDEFNPDSFVRGLECCLEEFQGRFRPSRRPWRTLVRVEEVDHERSYLYIVIPGWDSHEVVRLQLEDVPPEIQQGIEPEMRFHAQVNVGTESNVELYFEGWESD